MIMEAIIVFLFVICIALFFKVMSWRDEKREQHRCCSGKGY